MDREILARILVENVARWIDDDSRDEIVNMDLPRAPSKRLTVEEAEEMAKRGEGTFGHTTVIEPTDLDLYESYMYPPLTMPDKPEVMVSYWDMNRGPVNFMEGRVMVKAKCPDGIESWLVISVPVPNFYTAVEGNVWGWPKYVCDEMTVEHDRSEIIYEGKVRLSMDFTPGGVDEDTIQQLRDRGTEGGNTCSFHVKGGGMQLIRQGTGRSAESCGHLLRGMGAGPGQDLLPARRPARRPDTGRLRDARRLAALDSPRRRNQRDDQGQEHACQVGTTR